MNPIKIGSTVPAEKMHNIIEKLPKKRNINISYEEYKDRYIYSFAIGKLKYEEDIAIYNILSQFVNEIIREFYLKDLINKRIRKQDIYIDRGNQKRLVEEVSLLIKDKNLFLREKDKIYEEIFDYLIENQRIIIDGYIRFRPKSFERLIDKAIEFVLDHIQMELDYDEFIDMLKYFVDSNPPEIDLINLILREDNFELLDAENKKIDNKEIVETLKTFFQGEVNKSDILISSLIGMSPEKIVLHVEMGKEEELISILEKIFTHRINICYGCSLCNLKKYKQ